MSSFPIKTKRARRSSPRLNPVLPYLTPELWSKILEKLPYGDIHGLITSDDPNLAIMPKAAMQVKSLYISCPEELTLVPGPGQLCGVETLTAACWDDKEDDYIMSLPGNPGCIACESLPIDEEIGENILLLSEWISRLPKIKTVDAVGFGGAQCLPGLIRVSDGPRSPSERPDPLCQKIEGLCAMTQTCYSSDRFPDKYSRCVKSVVDAACFFGYARGKIPDEVDLTWGEWVGNAAAFCCNSGTAGSAKSPCHYCRMLCDSLPSRMLLPVASSESLDKICLDKDAISLVSASVLVVLSLCVTLLTSLQSLKILATKVIST